MLLDLQSWGRPPWSKNELCTFVLDTGAPT